MFGDILGECRESLERKRNGIWRKLGMDNLAREIPPSDGLTSQLKEHYLTLLSYGFPVWGAIAQANTTLFSKGTSDSAANTVYSPSSHFNNRPEELLKIASAVSYLKGKSPQDDELARVAATITDECNFVDKWFYRIN